MAVQVENDGESEHTESPVPPPAQTVYVTFRGENRLTNGGVLAYVDGWWEIHGLSFKAGVEVAYSLTDGIGMTCRTRSDLPIQKLPMGCTFKLMAQQVYDA